VVFKKMDKNMTWNNTRLEFTRRDLGLERYLMSQHYEKYDPENPVVIVLNSCKEGKG